MANLIYEKSDRLPSPGSIREAILVAVWLKRQELEIHKYKVIAAGFSDTVAALKGSNKATIEAFTDLINAAFPFAKSTKTEGDDALLKVMEKEVSKGAITFSPIQMAPIRDATKRYRMEREAAAKLQFKRKVEL